MKILTSPSSIGQISSKPFDLLIENGFEVKNNPFGRKLSENEVIELATGCVGIVAGVEPLTARVMDALPQLKCISRVGVGMDNVDLEYAKQKGIIVVNTPDGPTRAVAELTLGMTMALLRKIPHAHFDMKNHRWKKQTGNLLLGKQIGVIGLGRIGKMVAGLFRALGNKVIGYDLSPDIKWGNENNVEITDLKSVLSASDIVTIHVPAGNLPLISKKELLWMKNDALLINLSRGGVINEADLFEVLSTERLAGAAIDVFSKEPYNGPLCDLDNIVLTPHLGSYAKEGKLQMEIDAVKNLIDVLNRKK